MVDTCSSLLTSKEPDASQSAERDVFISHATEDKRKVARPLARQLEHLGFRVWLDETEIAVGDSLRAVIDRGLNNSRFGVVILSPSFFRKQWTEYELGGLLASGKTVLPVWHKVTRDDVASYSPGLAGLAAVPTSLGIKQVANRLAKAVRRELVPTLRPFSPRRWPGARNLQRLTAIVSAVAVITLLAVQGPDLWQHLATGEAKEAQTVFAPRALDPSPVSAQHLVPSLRVSSAKNVDQQPALTSRPEQSDAGSTAPRGQETSLPQPSQSSRESRTSPRELDVVKIGRAGSFTDFDLIRRTQETMAAVENVNRILEAQRDIDNFKRMQDAQRAWDSFRWAQESQRALESSRLYLQAPAIPKFFR